jgi:probable F420-dependent oxidoreductase
MKIDTSLLVHNLSQMPALARSADEMNFDGLWTFETAHEPFLPLVLAAEHSRRLTLGTSIAVAFARSPAVLAYMGWDLARFSKGRFIMGLGTQVKGHNERRFGVRWEKPVEKMRDTILAIRAIWNCWQNQTRLNFQGEFFTLNLMTTLLKRRRFTSPRFASKYLSTPAPRRMSRSSSCTGGARWRINSASWQQEESGTRCPV